MEYNTKIPDVKKIKNLKTKMQSIVKEIDQHPETYNTQDIDLQLFHLLGLDKEETTSWFDRIIGVLGVGLAISGVLMSKNKWKHYKSSLKYQTFNKLTTTPFQSESKRNIKEKNSDNDSLLSTSNNDSLSPISPVKQTNKTNLKKSNSECQQLIEEIKSKLEVFLNKVDMKSSSLFSLSSEMDEENNSNVVEKNAIESIQNQLNQLESFIQETQTQKNEQDAIVNLLQQQLKEQELELKEKTSQKKDLEFINNELKQQQNDFTQKISETSKIQKENEELKKNIKTCQSELNKTETERRKLYDKWSQLNNQITDIKKQISKVYHSNFDMKDISKFFEWVEIDKNTSKSRQDIITQKSKRIDDITQELELLKVKEKETSALNVTLEQENKGLKETTNVYEKQIGKQTITITELRQNLDKYTQTIQIQEQKIKNQEEELNYQNKQQLTKEKQQQQQIQELQQQLEQIKSIKQEEFEQYVTEQQESNLQTISTLQLENEKLNRELKEKNDGIETIQESAYKQQEEYQKLTKTYDDKLRSNYFEIEQLKIKLKQLENKNTKDFAVNIE